MKWEMMKDDASVLREENDESGVGEDEMSNYLNLPV